MRHLLKTFKKRWISDVKSDIHLFSDSGRGLLLRFWGAGFGALGFYGSLCCANLCYAKKIFSAIGEGRHGFDGQKCTYTASSPLTMRHRPLSALVKPLRLRRIDELGRYSLQAFFCSGETTKHLSAMNFPEIFVL